MLGNFWQFQGREYFLQFFCCQTKFTILTSSAGFSTSFSTFSLSLSSSVSWESNYLPSLCFLKCYWWKMEVFYFQYLRNFYCLAILPLSGTPVQIIYLTWSVYLSSSEALSLNSVLVEAISLGRAWMEALSLLTLILVAFDIVSVTASSVVREISSNFLEHTLLVRLPVKLFKLRTRIFVRVQNFVSVTFPGC